METTVCLGECADAVSNIYKWTKTTKPPFDLTWTPLNPSIRREPKGVVLIIAPFNYPLFLTVSPLVRKLSIIRPMERTAWNLGLGTFVQKGVDILNVRTLAWRNGCRMLYGRQTP